MRFIAPGPLPLEKFGRIEGYVKSQASGPAHVGGDFYAARVVDEETAGIVLGDGEGHGVPGLLNMLSLVTMFEAFWSESRSTTHVMDKIIALSNRLDVHGTAIYCIFTVIGKSLWLSVTSAGHLPLIILRAGPHVFACPAEGSTASGGMIGHPLKTPLAAERTEVHTGDIIIAYTDGVGELITREEMVEIGLRHLGDSIGVIAEEIFTSALNKNAGDSLADDATVLVVRVK
jgi:serine phosphatase RsbU (regulator of sigma subunit)